MLRWAMRDTWSTFHKQMGLWICSDVQMENSSQLVGNVMAPFSASMEVMKQIAVS